MAHAGFFAWASWWDPPPPEPIAERASPVELVTFEVQEPEPVLDRAGDMAPDDDPEATQPLKLAAAPPEPEVAEPTPSAPPPPARNIPTRDPDPTPTPETAAVPAADPQEAPGDEDGLGEASGEPGPAGQGATPSAPEQGGGLEGSGTPQAGRAGDGAPDFSPYGAEIVRIVMHEIDNHPVPGIAPHDTLELLLRVRPNGRLLSVGNGRFDVAQVVATSVGRLRVRQILRRVEQASHRFPRHPKGFRGRYYVVGIKVNFRNMKF